MRLNADTIHLLTTQASVIADWQQGAPSRRALVAAQRRGHWQAVTTRCFVSTPSDPTDEQRLWSAVLHYGPDAVLGGRNALVLAGWAQEYQWPTDVLVPRKSGSAPESWIKPHRVQAIIKAKGPGIPRSPAVQACLDAASWADTDRQAVFLVISVLQQGIVKADRLQRALAAQPRCRRRVLIAEVITDFCGGITTMGERDFARLCKRHGIRTPDRQVRRKDSNGKWRYLDVYFDKEGVVVEIDGFGHLDPEQWMDDLDKHNEIVLGGDHLVLRVSNWEVRYEPDRFVEKLKIALGLWRGSDV